MSNTGTQLSNPFSTGGGGGHFEAHVQALFVALMLTGGFAPCLPCWPIKKIKLQGKYAGYDTDDLIISVQKTDYDQNRRMLGQIKHSISITGNDKVFGKVIQSAWNDLNNPTIFTKNKDSIALITGPLSTTDNSDVRTILEWARHSESSEEFFKKIELARFSSKRKKTKLQVFKSQLKKANRGNDVSNEDLFQFLRHFHLLGYDLDIKAGVTLSLLHSLIGQDSQENAQSLWSRLIDEVQSANKNAGTITLEMLPDDLKAAFKKRTYETIPAALSVGLAQSAKPDWNQYAHSTELAIVNLLGSWDENNVSDTVIVSQLSGEGFSSWISKVREFLQQPKSPIALKNGIWSVVDRKELWNVLGPRLFDNDLDMFKQSVVNVLKEHDPQFDLPPEDRYAASIHGKVLKHSQYLRNGLAESIALLGSHPGALIHCSLNKSEAIAVLVVREIFQNAHWLLWGSLNNLLPLFAEAAPDEFLGAVDTALGQSPCPFNELFSQERAGVTGRNYMTGLLWALETLAWDEQFLVRVSVILGELSSHDPGGNWGNRPSNSLTTILLPWFPQTTASIEKRKVAVQTLQKEVPDVAWRLLISLLPNQHQTSTGSHKPAWRRTLPEDWAKEIPLEEYWNQVYFYADLTVQMAMHDIDRLNELISHLDNLPPPSFKVIMDHLSSEYVLAKPELERLGLWTGLTKFASKHRRFSHAKWAVSSDVVSQIESVAKTLAPSNPLNLHRRLFSGRDFDLYEEKGKWQEQQQQFEKDRQHAIKEILDYGGVEAVVQFSQAVESPWNVGYSLGFVAESSMDVVILPAMLDTEFKNLRQLASGYIWARHQSQGWAWVDRADTTRWSHSQIGYFLAYLPFTAETWKRANALLGGSEAQYWSRASVNPYQTDCDLEVAIDKLIEYGRPNAAVDCMNKLLYDKHALDTKRAVQALVSTVASHEPSYAMDAYNIVNIIKALQDASDTDPEDLFRVEWAYLPLLVRDHDASPKLLENRLASDSGFFCEVIRLVYRSKKEQKAQKEPTEQQKAIATNAYRLLDEWRTPPGMQSTGVFSKDHFRQWLESTRAACAESGHLEVALTHVGKVLVYCPPDPDGLWIHRAAAEALNSKDAEKMRDGFHLEILNSRGAHFVDPTGKPERDLATKYRLQAEDVENAGYQRLAVTLRDLAESYDRDAERIVAEHRQVGKTE